jgi:serine/threonine-protein kinase
MTTASTTYKKREYEKLIGKEINGRYDLESLLGFGGMGAVYKALQRNMQRRVALKLIPHGEPKAAARFKREALTISKLRHPNTVTVFDYGETADGMLFLAMEMLSGRTLGDVIKREAPLDPNRAVHIASQVCRSLSEAHDAGIIHRDIKPDNIFLIEVDDDENFAKVLDFGIAKSVQTEDEVTLTGEGRIIGTPRYMSPEQILAEEVDPRSDIYSLACIVFEMLCGTPPFDDTSTTKLMIAHAKESPPTLSERLTEEALSRIPGELEQVIRKALSKSPSERHSHIDVFRKELESAVEKLDSEPLPPGTGMRKAPPGAKRQPESSDLLDMHSSQSLDKLSQTRAAQKREPASAAPSESKDDGSRTRGLLIAGIIVLLLASVVGGYFAFVENDQSAQAGDVASNTDFEPMEPQPQPKATAAETQPDDEPTETLDFDESEPTTFKLEVLSAPTGASVYQGDKKWGETPFQRDLDVETGELELRFEKDGYVTRTRTIRVNVEPGGSQSVDVSLSKKRQQRRRPAARPTPKPTPKEQPEETSDEATAEKADKQEPKEPEETDTPKIDRLDDPTDPSVGRLK